ncbi:MAG: hypothetical protein QM500_09625 [Methylococcales bacterium]
MKKDYYRLSELSRNTEICTEDYQYIIENYKETLFLRLQRIPVMVVDEKLSELEFGNLDDLDGLTLDAISEIANNIELDKTKYIGNCVGLYTGLVRLSNSAKNNLLSNGSIHEYSVVLDDINGLKNITTDYPFKTELPNNVISEWNSVVTNDQYGIQAYLINNLEGELMLSPKVISFENLLVPNFQVEHIQHLLRESSDSLNSSEDNTQNLTDSAKQKRESDLHWIITQIILNKPSITAKAVWFAIEEDSTLDEGYRIYDKHNILTDVSATEICWESRYGNGGSLKFSSINVTVSKIKKKLF